jgi:hypothetical protein
VLSPLLRTGEQRLEVRDDERVERRLFGPVPLIGRARLTNKRRAGRPWRTLELQRLSSPSMVRSALTHAVVG